jgi:lipopolysaccharide heptosyltransferase II
LKENGLGRNPLVAINPIAKWDTKLWDADRFGVLADQLRESLNCDIVFTGGPEDRSVIEEISKTMRKRPVNFAGVTSLKDLACLYTRCSLLVTTDTGPMHMAAAMGRPTVALFGPTAPHRTGPYGKGHKVITADVECRPCFRKKCEDMRCMKEITVNRVYEGVMTLLKQEREDQ